MNLLARPGTEINCKLCACGDACNVASAHNFKVGECLFFAPKVKPKTNGDVIRAMSNEELVRFIYRFDPRKICVDKMLSWMEATAKE